MIPKNVIYTVHAKGVAMVTAMLKKPRVDTDGAVSGFFAQGPKQYRLQTSFVIAHVKVEEFNRIVNAFRRALLSDDRINYVKIDDDAENKRLKVKFDITANSFSDANFSSGKIILRALKQSMVDTGDLTDIERLKSVDEIDNETMKIVRDQSTQLSLV